MSSRLHALTAVQIAAGVRSGQLKATEVLEQHLARIRTREGEIHAFNPADGADDPGGGGANVGRFVLAEASEYVDSAGVAEMEEPDYGIAGDAAVGTVAGGPEELF